MSSKRVPSLSGILPCPLTTREGRFFNICALQLCMVYLPCMLNQLRSLGVPLSLSHINTHLYNYMHKKYKNMYIHTFGHHWVKWVNTLQQCFTVFHWVLVCPRRSHALGRRNGSSQGERLAYLSWGAELNQPSASPTAELQGTNGPRSVPKVPADQRHQINK